MELHLDDTQLSSGDNFHLYFFLHNPENTAYDCDAYLLLGVYGMYWCWPSWVEITTDIDSEAYTVPSMGSITEECLQFAWPQDIGSAEGLEFIGCIFEPGSWNMIGDVQYIQWSYGP
jgi:hypothetical protein